MAAGHIPIQAGTGILLIHGAGLLSIMGDGSGMLIEVGYGALTLFGVHRGFPGGTAPVIADGLLYLQGLDLLLEEDGPIMGLM